MPRHPGSAHKTSATRIERPGVRAGYDLWAKQYDASDNPLVFMDRRYTLAALQAQVGEWVLDAGCGTGSHLLRLHEEGARVVGVDFSLGMLAVAARRQSNLPLVVGDLQASLPFRSSTFDAILCSLVSEHLQTLTTFSGEMHRLLVPGGRLVFAAFHPDLAAAGIEANFEKDGIEYRLGAETHDEAAFVGAFATAGFVDIQTQTHAGDAALVAALPQARKYLGRNLLLLVQARRPG